MTRARPPAGPGRGPGSLRIVGGLYRGRRLPIPDWPGLRPTPDRVRETLFNWLAPTVLGARCLDPFAGSGALGLEAASRGAARVVLIERAPPVARQLRENARTLGAAQVEVRETDALRWLETQPVEPFDLVLLDPPYDLDLLAPACTMLARRGWLAPRALVYLETASRAAPPELPPGWAPVREGSAGAVRFALVRVETALPGGT